MTRRLYEEDSYCRRFEATVLSCEPAETGFAVILDATAFFPEGGGQAADPGTLNGVPVTDVQIDPEGTVHHFVTGPLAVGERVTGELDWEERFSRMQTHTGEHIVSGIVHRLHGMENVGFHLGADEATMDISGELTREQLDEVERLANRAVTANVPVTARVPDPEELETLFYRSKGGIDGPVRIVTVEGVDACACCAPHVRRSGDVGSVKLLEAVRWKGGMRIRFCCGERAVADHRMRFEQTAAAAALLSVKAEELTAAVERLLGERDGLRAAVRAARKQLALARVAALPTTDAPVCLFDEDGNGESVRETVNAMTARLSGPCAVFSGSDADGYRYVAAGGDLPGIARRMREELGAKGGGNAAMIQGKVTVSRERLEAFWASLAQE